MGRDKNVRTYKQLKLLERRQQLKSAAYREQLLAEAKDAGVDPLEPRPHGTNLSLFNDQCDCDQCQIWDELQRVL